MASESIRFDFLTTGADRMARDFKTTGDNAASAARGAAVLQDVIKKLGEKENRTAAESANLAKALRLTGDAEDRAAAKALGAEIAIKRLGDSMKDASKKTDGARGGIRGLLSEVAGFGAAADAASSKGNKFKLALAGLNLASGVLEPVMAGVVVAAGGLAAGFAAAGAGLGVFGLVAKSTFTAASTAATKVQNAQIAYNAAIASGVKPATAYRTEQQAILKAYAQLSPAQIQLSKQIGDAQNQWQSFVQSNTSGVAKIITQGIGLLPKVFAAMQPFLAPTEKALAGIIGQLGKGLSSPGFKSFIGAFAQNSGPALTKIAKAIGNIIVGIGGILKAFLPTSQSLLSGLDKITAKFRQWGTTLSGHSGFQSLMQTFRTETPQAVAILKNLGTVLLNVGKAMFGLSTFSNSKLLLQALLPLSGILASLSKNTALDRIVLYLYAASVAAGKLKPALAGVKAGIEGIGVALKFASANPILLIAAAVIALGVAFYVAWKKSAGFRDFIKSIGVALLAAGIIVVKANKAIVDSFLSMVGTILHGAADAFGWIPGLGSKLRGASRAFDNFKAGVDGSFNSMVKTMQGWQGELDRSKNKANTATQIISGDFGKQLLATKRSQRGVNDLAVAIGQLHGKTVNVGVHGSGSGGAKITVSSVGGGAFAGKLVAISNRARGGMITGGIPGRDSVLGALMPGEVVVPTGMVKAGAVDHLRGKLPGFAAGGLVTPPPNVWGGRVEGSYGADGKGAFGSAAAAAYNAVISSVTNAVKAAATAAAGGIGNYKPGAGVAQWRGVVQQALGLAGANVAQLTDPVLYQMQTESGGNPTIVNKWDINWQEGHPSVGLMQVIRGTFETYAGRFRNTGPFEYGVSVNPLANVYSAIRYAQANYGPGLRNAYGGIGSGHGYDQGGWLMPGLTLAYNGTGRPEQVIPPPRAGARGAHAVLEVRGGGQSQVEQFMLWMIRNLVRVHGGGDAQTAFGRR